MLKRLIIIAALLLPLGVMAQETPNVVVGPPSHQQREADKKKQKKKEQAEKAEQKGIKEHNKIQDKETRKRMKKSRHEADRVNSNKRKGNFFTRLFTKKH